MKLYATTTSERASKGQGGNDYLNILVKNEDQHKILKIDIVPSKFGLYQVSITSDKDVFIQFYTKSTKGEKQKGENYLFESVDKTIKRIKSDNDTRYDNE